MIRRSRFVQELRKRCDECEDWLRRHVAPANGIFNALANVRDAGRKVDDLQTRLGGYKNNLASVKNKRTSELVSELLLIATLLLLVFVCWCRSKPVTACTIAALAVGRCIYVVLLRREESEIVSESLDVVKECRQTLVTELIKRLEDAEVAMRVFCDILSGLSETIDPDSKDFRHVKLLQRQSFEWIIFYSLLTGFSATRETLEAISRDQRWAELTMPSNPIEQQLLTDGEEIGPVEDVLQLIKPRSGFDTTDLISTDVSFS